MNLPEALCALDSRGRSPLVFDRETTWYTVGKLSVVVTVCAEV